jgi:transmembrane sensor
LATEYELFTPDDWVFDTAFRRWVLNPSVLEDRFWQQYIAANPAQREAIAHARVLILYSQQQPAVSAEQLDRSWQSLQNRLPEPVVRSLWSRSWFSVAASVTVILLSGLAWWLYQHTPETYQTAYGETRQLTLPDGSRVTLNANSSLQLARNWEPEAAREVWLEGEAFFSVTHQQNHQKFVVHARQLDVQVLGTEFNVFTRPKAVKVVLESGSVKLSQPDKSPDQGITMKPGQFFEVKADGSQQWRTIRPEPYSAWKEKRLVLEQTTLADLVEILQDNYGLTVEVPQEELLRLRASGSMPLTDADDVLLQIEKLFSLTIKRSGTTVTLHKL